MELTSKMKSVAMQAKSVEELLKLAEAYGYEISKEEAEEIFAELNQAGELSDEELENVTGGSCYSTDSDTQGLLIVTLGNTCDGYVKGSNELIPGTCHSCKHRIGFTPSYCKIRSKYNDPYR